MDWMYINRLRELQGMGVEKGTGINIYMYMYICMYICIYIHKCVEICVNLIDRVIYTYLYM
jgi:hypothetical protein